MCFNGVKSWQLGWYEDASKTFDTNVDGGLWSGQLVGVAGYNNGGLADNQKVVVKIETGTNKDYFVQYNRKTGINSGTLEAGNLVTIQESGGA